jgi:hypothetical protein
MTSESFRSPFERTRWNMEHTPESTRGMEESCRSILI